MSRGILKKTYTHSTAHFSQVAPGAQFLTAALPKKSFVHARREKEEEEGSEKVCVWRRWKRKGGNTSRKPSFPFDNQPSVEFSGPSPHAMTGRKSDTWNPNSFVATVKDQLAKISTTKARECGGLFRL